MCVGTREITMKLLKLKHTFKNTTYSKAARFRFTGEKWRRLTRSFKLSTLSWLQNQPSTCVSRVFTWEWGLTSLVWSVTTLNLKPMNCSKVCLHCLAFKEKSIADHSLEFWESYSTHVMVTVLNIVLSSCGQIAHLQNKRHTHGPAHENKCFCNKQVDMPILSF